MAKKTWIYSIDPWGFEVSVTAATEAIAFKRAWENLEPGLRDASNSLELVEVIDGEYLLDK